MAPMGILGELMILSGPQPLGPGAAPEAAALLQPSQRGPLLVVLALGLKANNFPS